MCQAGALEGAILPSLFFIFFVSKNDRSPKVDCLWSIVSPVVRRGAKEANGVEPIVEVGNKYFSSFRGGVVGFFRPGQMQRWEHKRYGR